MKILKQHKNFEEKETRYQSGFQKLVDLAGQFSNQFLADLQRLSTL